MTTQRFTYYLHIYKWIRCRTVKLPYFLLLFFLLQTGTTRAQKFDTKDKIEIEIRVPGIGDTTVAAILYEGAAWLSIHEVFDFLKIYNIVSPGGDSISGFFIKQEKKFLFDGANKRILFNGVITEIPETALIQSQHTLFLRSDMFDRICSVDCRFDYRSLSVNLFTELEIPAIIEKKRALMRENIGMLKHEITADTSFGIERPGFRLGMIDWSLYSTNGFKGTNDIRANVSMGAVVAGGETTVSLQYNDKTILDKRQQYYIWRYINNDHPFLKQLSIGKIFPNAISSLYAPVIGVQFSNSPSVLRRSFGSYRINRYTDPGWIVELYINNTLVNYTKADASGFYSFEIPILYGYTQVQFRYYGPNGEQRTDDENINMPFTFLPTGKLEYNVNAGFLEDSVTSRFSHAQVNYGLSKQITLGSGIEYLSSISTRKFMPFLTADFRFGRNLLFSTQHTQGVKSSITGNYSFSSNMLFEMNYTKYVPGQKAIYNSYLEERRAAISFPIRLKKFSTYSRLSCYQIILPGLKYLTVESLFSGMIFGTSTNFTTYALFEENNTTYLYSNLAMTFRLPAKIMIMPQVQYEYHSNRIISLKAEMEKRISTRGYMNAYYERNIKSDFQSFNVGIRYDLPYMQAGYAMRKSTGSELSLISSLRGGIAHDRRTGYFGFSDMPGLGKGGIILLAFLDLNNNGRKDPGEPKLSGLRYTINGGLRDENKRDSSLVIRNLEANNSYLLIIDRNSFDEIAWQIKKANIRVDITANQFRLIEVPVSVFAEVSGTIYKETEKGRQPQQRVLLNIYNHLGIRVAQTLSENEGYYSYLGLIPGSYTIKPDQEQMQKLGLQSYPKAWHFEIEGTMYGDVCSNLVFVLQKTNIKK